MLVLIVQLCRMMLLTDVFQMFLETARKLIALFTKQFCEKELNTIML